MGKTTYQLELDGAMVARKRDMDRCPNCGVHSDYIIPDLKIWKCDNENCRVAYFDHE